jgi:hypothetical protein
MIESLILIEGESVKEEDLNISLMNAKQLIKGNVPGFGTPMPEQSTYDVFSLI